MRYYFIGIFLLLFCSCTIRRKLYSSTQINCPSLRQKNDHSFSLAFGAPSGFDLTGGYALTNRVAVIGGAYSYRNKDKQTESTFFSSISATASLLYRHSGFHGGLGVFFPLSRKNPDNMASFFAGYTGGRFRMDEHNIETDNSAGTTVTRDLFYKSNIGRYFIQAHAGFSLSRFEFSLQSRYNYVVYDDFETNYSTSEQQTFSFPPLGYSRYSQFIDFGFDGKYFFTDNRRVGVQAYWLFTSRLNKKEFNFIHYNSRIGAGLVIRNPFKRNK